MEQQLVLLEAPQRDSPSDRSDAEGQGDTAQVPFLPGTNIQWAWDSTSLGYFKTCPRLYQYIMIDGWTSEGESIHLRFGQELHSALQNYHKSRAANIDHEGSVHDVIRELIFSTYGWVVDTTTRAGKYKNRASLIGAVIHYLDQYEDDPAKTFIKEDGEAAVELSFRFELDFGPSVKNYKCRACDEATSNGETVSNSCGEPCNFIMHPTDGDEIPIQPYVLCGHLDRVVDFNGALFVMDYKTTLSTPGSYYFDQYEPNNQMSLYTLASQVILDSPIKGVIIDAVQMLIEPPFMRSVRGFTYRTEAQLEEWMSDLGWILSQAELYAEQNYWPMNDTACDKFGGCRFRGICSKSPQVREQFLKSDFVKGEKWNPLRVR